jgi:hypothetical protein
MKLLDHISLPGIDLADVEIHLPTGWVSITKQNWGLTVHCYANK